MLSELRVSEGAAIARFPVQIDLTIRTCREEDLPDLEWFGMFRDHRQILNEAFERQRRGTNLMLVAVLDEFPVGQAWIDLERRRAAGAGWIWAVRVFPLLRGLGVGARLLGAAEDLLRQRGYRAAELGVEKHNVAARSLYERCGYEVVDEIRESYAYVTPDGRRIQHEIEEWVLHKPLDEEGP